MFTALFLLFLILTFSILAGYRLSRLLLPEKFMPYRFLLAPFTGFALIEILVQNLNALGIPCGKSAWPIAVTFLCLELFFLLKNVRFKSSPGFFARFKFFLRDSNFQAFLPGIFSALILIGPLFEIGYLTCFGGGTDATGYIRYAYFLQNNPIYAAVQSPDAAYPWYGWAHAAIRDDFLGASYLLSFFSSLFSLDPLFLFNVIMASYGFLAPLAVYIVMKMCFAQNEKISLLCASLMACQNFWQMPGYAAFLNQMSAIPYFILLFGFIYLCLKENDARLYALAGIFVTALISHYSVVLAMLLFFLPASIAVNCALKDAAGIKKTLRGAAIIFFLPILTLQIFSYFTLTSRASYTFPDAFARFVKTDRITNIKGLLGQYLARGFETGTYRPDKNESGPFLDEQNPSADVPKYWSGFFNLERTYKPWIGRSPAEKMFYGMFQLIFFLLAALSIFLIDETNAGSGARKYFTACLIVSALFILYPFAGKYWYGLWKTMTFVQFLFIIGVCVSLEFLWNKTANSPKLRAAFCVFLFVFTAHNLIKDFEMVHRPFAVCDKQILDIKNLQPQILSRLKSNEGLLVSLSEQEADAYDFTQIAYMLKNVPVIIPDSSPALKHLFFTEYQHRALTPRLQLVGTNSGYRLADLVQ